MNQPATATILETDGLYKQSERVSARRPRVRATAERLKTGERRGKRQRIHRGSMSGGVFSLCPEGRDWGDAGQRRVPGVVMPIQMLVVTGRDACR